MTRCPDCGTKLAAYTTMVVDGKLKPSYCPECDREVAHTPRRAA